MNIRQVILGLLAQQPMSGYDIKSLFKGLSWLIDAPSYGSLYPRLHALLEEGLVTVRVEPGQGKPARKLYEISDSGRRELVTALESDELTGRSIKTFARQLILAECLSRDTLIGHLASRREALAQYVQRKSSDEAEQEPGRRLIDDYGRTLAEAELTWLEARLAEFAAEEHQLRV